MRRITLLILLVIVSHAKVHAEGNQRYITRLARAGFENISFSQVDSTHIYLKYENRIYRNEVRAAGEIMRLLVAEDSSIAEVSLIPCKFNMPICEIRIDVALYVQYVRGLLDAKTFGRSLSVRPLSAEQDLTFSARQNSSYGRIDATITIGHQIQLGQYDDRFKIYGQAQPGLVSNLWSGNKIYAEAAIPFHDEIGIYDKGSRLAKMGLTQILRLPYHFYGMIHGGIFSPERWGVSLELATYCWQYNLLIGLQWDKTGFFYHEKDKWFYSSMDLNTCKIYCQYYPEWLDLVLGIDWSQYLLGDEGWRVTLRRSFAETDVDLYFAVTDFDKFGGVKLCIPLPPARRMRPARLRLSWPKRYGLGYRATNRVYTFGAPLQTGLAVETGLNLIEFQKEFSHAHIINNLKSWRE